MNWRQQFSSFVRSGQGAERAVEEMYLRAGRIADEERRQSHVCWQDAFSEGCCVYCGANLLPSIEEEEL